MTTEVSQNPSSTNDEKVPKIFSRKGRLGRLSFAAWYGLVGSIFALLIFPILFRCLFSYSFHNHHPHFPDNLIFPIIIFFIFGIILLYLYTVLSIKRVHDCNQSGWMVLLSFIPIVNILFSIYLYCAAGTSEANQYGNVRETKAWEKYLGWFYIVVLPLFSLLFTGVIFFLSDDQRYILLAHVITFYFHYLEVFYF